MLPWSKTRSQLSVRHRPAMAPHLQATTETTPAASTHVPKGTISVLSHVMPASLPQHRCCD